jgi:hypothetical protein
MIPFSNEISARAGLIAMMMCFNPLQIGNNAFR